MLRGHTYPVFPVHCSPDGQYVATGDSGGTIKVWDVRSGKELTSFVAEGSITSIDISPDGTIVIAGENTGRVHFLKLEKLD